MKPAPEPKPGGNLRWLMVFLAFSATAINYIDRANLGVAAPFIAKDLNLSPESTGALLGAFFWTYAAFQLPSGWFIDKVGARVAYLVDLDLAANPRAQIGDCWALIGTTGTNGDCVVAVARKEFSANN